MKTHGASRAQELQQQLEAILVESAKAAAARCMEACMAHIEEERKLFAEQAQAIAGCSLQAAKSTLGQTLHALEETKAALAVTPPLALTPPRGSKAQDCLSPEVQQLVQRMAGAENKLDSLETQEAAADDSAYFRGLDEQIARFDTQAILRKVFIIHERIVNITSQVTPPRSPRLQTGSTLQAVDHSNVLSTLSRITSAQRDLGVEAQASVPSAAPSRLDDQLKGRSPSEIFGALNESARKSVGSCQPQEAKKDAKVSPPSPFSPNKAVLSALYGPGAESPARTMPSPAASILPSPPATTMRTSPGERNLLSPSAAAIPTANLQARASPALSATVPASLSSTAPPLPNLAPSGTSPLRKSPAPVSPVTTSEASRGVATGSSMEAARVYAARNAELGRCLAEITADLQRACIISSSCKTSLRSGSNSPLKREPTSPSATKT